MIINNKLLEESFSYKHNLQGSDLKECIISIDEIYLYVSKVEERLYFDIECIFMQEIKEGISLADWLWGSSYDGDKEVKDMLVQILTKPMGKEYSIFDDNIEICLYPDGSHVSTLEQYVAQRRGILSKIADKGEFCSFMPSCFADSVFSVQIKNGLNQISDFSVHTEEIVKNLSVLNDEALDIYRENRSNLRVAYKILTSKLLECSPDPENVKHLRFEFINDMGDIEIVECSPHTKLVREDSNLRIYFYWCHDNIGSGNKVLIGRIGTHPYR